MDEANTYFSSKRKNVFTTFPWLDILLFAADNTQEEKAVDDVKYKSSAKAEFRTTQLHSIHLRPVTHKEASKESLPQYAPHPQPLSKKKDKEKC